jgi:hypothetical protein
MKENGGRQVLHDLVKHCDVLVENYLPGKLSKLGLGYKELSNINSRLVYASITGYGQTGPYANRPGYDVVIEAEAGLMHITGEPDGKPVKVGVAITGIPLYIYNCFQDFTNMYLIHVWDNRLNHRPLYKKRYFSSFDSAWDYRKRSTYRLFFN